MDYKGPPNSKLLWHGDHHTVVVLPQETTITDQQAWEAYERLKAAREYQRQCLQQGVRLAAS
jgi:hypothetical protein